MCHLKFSKTYEIIIGHKLISIRKKIMSAHADKTHSN